MVNNLSRWFFVSCFVGTFNMRKHISLVLLLLCFLATTNVYAQRKLEQLDPEKKAEEQEAQKEKDANKMAGPKWYDKVSFGGNVGGSFSNYGSFFTVQPMAFYRFTDKTLLGAGLTYYYWSRDFSTAQGTVNISDNAYGGNVFGRQVLFESIFAHAEYMPLNFKVYNPATNDIKRDWVGAFYLGGGINQPISDRANIYILVLYDLLHDSNRSFRSSPLDFRTGFYF